MTEEYKRRLADVFDARAAGYDDDHSREGFARRLVDLAAPRPGERVLDAATGTGLVAIPTAQRVGPHGRVLGVDISAGMLAGAAKAVAAAGLGNVELMHADAEALALPPSSFDLVLCSSGLPYMGDIPAALRLWRGLLKPGGRVAFNCWSDTSYDMGPLLRAVADRHGIELPATVEEVGAPSRCRAVLRAAGFARAAVVVEPMGKFITEAEAERAWERWMRNPLFRPADAGAAAALVGLREEYLVDVRRLLTDRGIWDEATIYYVTGWREMSP